jgi:peptidoglycan/LPS O-acetylase OafA/YrhL
MTDEFKSKIVDKNRLLLGIHGLRGVAALAVVFFHLVHVGGINSPDAFMFIGRDFGISVHLFFIVSAYSLCYSTEFRMNHPKWVQEYFVKRFFRIAPLFYVMILLELSRQFIMNGRVMKSFSEILLNLTFTFGFVPFSDLVWGSWSVGVEMIFYTIFPVLLMTLRTHRSVLVMVGISFVLSCLIRSALHAQETASTPNTRSGWADMAFASNFCFFALGIYAYHISRLYKTSILASRLIPALSVVTLGALLLFNGGKYFNGGGNFIIYAIWGLGLTALCVWQSAWPSLLIANWVFEYLGERSFSIYLLHPVVIFYSKTYLARVYNSLEVYFDAYAFFICATFIIVLVLVFAEFTYRFIEVPGIKFGRELIKQEKLT